MSSDPVTHVIVLNGGSSSGKSSIARGLQELLPGLWLTFGVDAFIEALPGRGESPRADITYGSNGTVQTGPGFKLGERVWRRGLAEMAREGVPLILDEVFLSGGAAQAPLRRIFDGLGLLWVGVHCDAGVATAREAQRSDRIPGMARQQAESVHAGMAYDVEVDTTHLSPDECARAVAAHVIAESV